MLHPHRGIKLFIVGALPLQIRHLGRQETIIFGTRFPIGWMSTLWFHVSLLPCHLSLFFKTKFVNNDIKQCSFVFVSFCGSFTAPPIGLACLQHVLVVWMLIFTWSFKSTMFVFVCMKALVFLRVWSVTPFVVSGVAMAWTILCPPLSHPLVKDSHRSTIQSKMLSALIYSHKANLLFLRRAPFESTSAHSVQFVSPIWGHTFLQHIKGRKVFHCLKNILFSA